MNGAAHTVIGIMPPQFQYPELAQLWIPQTPIEFASARTTRNLQVIARLKSGVSLAQAQTEMDVVAHRLEQEYPATNKGVGAKVLPLHEDLYRFAGPILYPLFGAVAFVKHGSLTSPK